MSKIQTSNKRLKRVQDTKLSCKHVSMPIVYPTTCFTADGVPSCEHTGFSRYSPIINNTERSKPIAFVYVLSSFLQDKCLQNLKRLLISVTALSSKMAGSIHEAIVMV